MFNLLSKKCVPPKWVSILAKVSYARNFAVSFKNKDVHMKKIVLFSVFLFSLAISALAQHNAGHNGKILMIASNPSVSKQTGWPIGAWYAEVTHPYWAFTEAGQQSHAHRLRKNGKRCCQRSTQQSHLGRPQHGGRRHFADGGEYAR